LIAVANTALTKPLLGQADALTLEQCVSIALDQNPLIQSAREQHRASQARVSQAWAFPQPSLDFDSDLQPTLGDFGRSEESYVGISGSIPFPTKTYLRGRIAQKEANEALTDVAVAELEIAFQVKATFYGLLLTRELVTYARQNLELSRDFVNQTELKFGAGDVPRVEVIRARVEAARAATELRRAENKESLTRARLNFLLARPGTAPLEISGQPRSPPIAHSLDQLTSLALSSRPEIARIAASLQRASLTKTLGYMSYLPDFQIGAARHRQSGVEDAWQVTLSVELPIFFWQPAIGEIREANSSSQALEQEASHLKNLISLEVEEAHRGYTTAVNQIEVMENEIISQAEEVYEMYLFSYRQGEIGGIELLEAQRTLSEARKAYANSLYDYDVAIASLEKSIGRTLGEN
jgi:outer membrane protein TolC